MRNPRSPYQAALHATNVYHYDHVLLAMQRIFRDVGLVRRLELTPADLERFRRFKLPDLLLQQLARRVRHPAEIAHGVFSLGPAQLLLPALTRMGLQTKPWHIQAVTAEYARRTATVANSYKYFHFSEGLGHRALERHDFVFSICERRNFHHAVYENEVEVYHNYPVNGQPDPIGHILDYEYAHADRVLVYSQAAKASFIHRGFTDSKVQVSPIGIGPQLPRLDLRREPYRLLYVGRSDVHKGLDLAVATTRMLGRPFRLEVAGAMAPVVTRWLNDIDCVDYLGILSREELRAAYSRSAAMILPSTESFGLAAAEAVYHGLPLLCSDKTGIGEYLPASSKSVVTGRDPSVWAAAALALLERHQGSDADVLHADVAAALKDLSCQSAANQLEMHYKNLLRSGADEEATSNERD